MGRPLTPVPVSFVFADHLNLPVPYPGRLERSSAVTGSSRISNFNHWIVVLQVLDEPPAGLAFQC